MNSPTPFPIDWNLLSPILWVAIAGVIALIVLMFEKKRTNWPIIGVCLAGLIGAGAVLVQQLASPDASTLGGQLLRDRTGLMLQLGLVGSCFLAMLFSEGYLREKGIAFAEFYPLAMWSTVGGMLMVASTNLLVIFLGLEVLSIALYVLAGLSRQESKSEESAIKYFLLGAFASGFFLYGIAFFYGATGTVQLEQLGAAWAVQDQTTRNLLVFSIGLMLIGMFFKAAFVPFHQWTPDVYQGAPTNVTAFMAAGSKIAAIGTLYRILEAAVPARDLWMPALFWIAILTMTVGNLIALTQKDVKRVLGYSSISNAGYVLVAIMAHLQRPDVIGVGATVFYLLSYAFMTIGAFAVVSLTAKEGREGTRFSDLYGLWHRNPLAAGVLILFVASLVGVPPTSGFFGKLFIFQDAVAAGMLPLAIVLAVNSAISAYYYLGIAQAVFVQEEGAIKNVSAKGNIGLSAALLLCAAGVLGLAFMVTPIMSYLAVVVK